MARLWTLRCHPACLLTVWGLFVGVGMISLGDYAARPGQAASAPARWPSESPIRREGHRPTLLMFLHPRCPCSRASVAELSSIAGDCGDRVSIHAVLLQPDDGRESWGESELGADLAVLPRLRIWPDLGGAEARRFGVSTSGHVLLYDAGGHLIYSGGITPARGHQGANDGRDAVLAGILGTGAGIPKSPVFGCALESPRRSSSQGPRR
jgi:hypothetical protein